MDEHVDVQVDYWKEEVEIRSESLKNEIDQIETNFCLNTSKDEIFKLRRRDAIKSSSETQLSIPSTTLRKLLPKQGKSLNQKKHYSIENDIEIKRNYIRCKRDSKFIWRNSDKYLSKSKQICEYIKFIFEHA